MLRQQYQAWSLVAVLLASTTSAATNVSVSAPVSIPPSEYWDGNDGQWSTFQIEVGTPSQLVRLLPGTSASAGTSIWVVIPQGCSEANPELAYSTCANSRGNLFSRNESTTWSTNRLANNGLYGLDTYEESELGLSGNAYYGFDSIGLLPGSSNAIASTELIAGIATDGYWLGSLGISPLPMNFTSLDEPVSRLLENLRNTSVIPSTSWAYTAGAVYRQPPVFGSLTLGGYDASRVENSSISLPFGADQSRDLLVGLQSITYDTFGSAPLLAQSIDIFVDSMISQMWLPLDVCQQFGDAFGLTWNNSTQLYVLNDTTHAQLQAQNPTFTFTIAAPASGTQGNMTNITLPYSAFDLNISAPYVNGSLPYFPLKRAQNSSQYTLGRVFLQEAYLIADYDRRNFSIGQALFPSNSTQDLKAIMPPGAVVNPGSGRSSLSGGAIAGIVVGVVVAVVLLIGILVYLRRRRLQQRKATRTAELNGVATPPADKEPPAERILSQRSQSLSIHPWGHRSSAAQWVVPNCRQIHREQNYQPQSTRSTINNLNSFMSCLDMTLQRRSWSHLLRIGAETWQSSRPMNEACVARSGRATEGNENINGCAISTALASSLRMTPFRHAGVSLDSMLSTMVIAGMFYGERQKTLGKCV